MSKRKRFSSKFKAKMAIEALKERKTLTELSQEHQITPGQITTWKSKAIEDLFQIFEDDRKKKKSSDIDIESLYAEIGKLKVELDFLKKKL
jgi:transposase